MSLSEKIMELSPVMCSECKNHTNCDWYYRPSQLAICPEDAKAILSLIHEEVAKLPLTSDFKQAVLELLEGK